MRFHDISLAKAKELASGSFGEDFRVVLAPDTAAGWKRFLVSPKAPPVVVAELPKQRTADVVQDLQEAGHCVLYVGANEDELDAVGVATIPGAFGINGCEAVQNAADLVLISNFLGSLAFAKHRCAIASASPEKFVLYSLCPKCSPVTV